MDIRNRDDARPPRERAAGARGRGDAPPAEVVGEVVGGVSGLATGAALGALGGPIGSVIGAIAGAATGWWSGRAVSDAAASFDDDEEYYRQHFASTSTPIPDLSVAPQLQDTKVMRAVRRDTLPDDVAPSDDPADAEPGEIDGYERARPAYQIGYLAGMNPDYRGRDFEDVEGDLRAGWSDEISARHGRWEDVRDYARGAYERGRDRTPAPRVPADAPPAADTRDRVAGDRDARDRDARDRDARDRGAR